MNTKISIALLAFAVPCIAFAQDAGKYQCTHGDLVRRVEIFTEPGMTVPCEVHYFKDTEAPGETQVLWSAQSQAGYCESKASEFVSKLEGWGWNCSAAAAPAPTDDSDMEPEVEQETPPAYDDTDVLSPGNPSGS
jgi:hypothetical protein